MEGVRDQGLINVNAVTTIFPHDLVLHELNEMLQILFHFVEVRLCSVVCCTMVQPHTFGEVHDVLFLGLECFAPDVREQVTHLLPNHAGSNLNTAL